MKNNEKIEKLLKGILLYHALKEKEREAQVRVLKAGGLNQTEINSLIGISDAAKRMRKHRSKKKKK